MELRRVFPNLALAFGKIHMSPLLHVLDSLYIIVPQLHSTPCRTSVLLLSFKVFVSKVKESMNGLSRRIGIHNHTMQHRCSNCISVDVAALIDETEKSLDPP